ncbi:SDR family NAD(P)-dependent oxidoreductase, partial [Thalassovita aquimarina]
MFDLSGKTALVTGSTMGIGKGLARGLAEAGAEIILNGRDRDRLVQVAEEFRADGFRVHTLPFDATD